jgi:hypothetical protein
MATEAQKRKSVQEAIDKVLFKVRVTNLGSMSGGQKATALRVLNIHMVSHLLQINELEAIVGEFNGNNELLHTKL